MYQAGAAAGPLSYVCLARESNSTGNLGVTMRVPALGDRGGVGAVDRAGWSS